MTSAPLVEIQDLGFAWPGRRNAWTSGTSSWRPARRCFSKALPAAARPPCSACSAACSVPVAARCACSVRTWEPRHRPARPFSRRPHRLSLPAIQSAALSLGLGQRPAALPVLGAAPRARLGAAWRSPGRGPDPAPRPGAERSRAAPPSGPRTLHRPAAARRRRPRPDRPAGTGDRRRTTSALDSDHRDAFLQLLFAECAAAGAGLLFVSHDRSLASRFDRHLTLAQLNAARPET